MPRSLVTILVVLAFVPSGCGGNQGAKTSCRDFLKMSEAQRHSVIAKMGYPPNHGPNAYWTDAAQRNCAGQPSDTNVGDAIDGVGP